MEGMDRRKFLHNAIATAVAGTAAEAALTKPAESREMTEASRAVFEYIDSLKSIFLLRAERRLPEPTLTQRFNAEFARTRESFLETFTRAKGWQRTPAVDAYALGSAMSLAQFETSRDPQVTNDLVNSIMEDWQAKSQQVAAESQFRR